MPSASNGQSFYGTVPELPPRIDRASKPPGQFPTSPSIPSTAQPTSRNNLSGTFGRSAQERLFGSKSTENNAEFQDEYTTRANLMNAMDKRNSGNSLDRKQNSLDRPAPSNVVAGVPGVGNNNNNKANGSYDSVSSYDSCNTTQISMQRLGPNAPDDLKSVPPAK